MSHALNVRLFGIFESAMYASKSDARVEPWSVMKAANIVVAFEVTFRMVSPLDVSGAASRHKERSRSWRAKETRAARKTMELVGYDLR
jgi:hypothetical protein